jgi:hypothetical protein
MTEFSIHAQPFAGGPGPGQGPVPDGALLRTFFGRYFLVSKTDSLTRATSVTKRGFFG